MNLLYLNTYCQRLLLYILLPLLLACQNSSKTKSTTAITTTDTMDITIYQDVDSSVEIIKSQPILRNYEYDDYTFEVNPEVESLQVIARNPSGSKIEDLGINVEGELKSTHVMDMNADGNPEFVIISQTPNGEEVQVYCFTKRTALPVYVADEMLEDVAGEVSFAVKDNQLVCSYLATDGSQSSVSYNLVAGEAGYRLEPWGMSPAAMKTKVYGTFISAEPAEYIIRKMTISDNGLGEIVVRITATDTQRKAQICNFTAIGRLVKGEIRINLKNVDTALD
ncbi:MAG: hypothetical protein AAF847_15260, partial [Bacteroidota bacterium]